MPVKFKGSCESVPPGWQFHVAGLELGPFMITDLSQDVDGNCVAETAPTHFQGQWVSVDGESSGLSNTILYPEEEETMSDWRHIAWRFHEKIVKEIKPKTIEDVRFLTLALSGEVGEFANVVKKEWRGDGDLDMENVAEELADIRIYLELLARTLEIDLDAECENVIHGKLRDRWPNEYADELAPPDGEG